VNLNHLTETAAATFGGRFARRAATVGVAAAAIIGVAAGPAAAANSPKHTSAPAAAVATSKAPTAVISTAATSKIAIVNPTIHKPAAPKPAAHKPAAHKPAAPKPATKALLPHGHPTGQVWASTSANQRSNAAAIVKAGIDMKLPPRAMVMAVACSLQESKLHNYGNLGNRNDHDSLGLFQQRPSSGWGTPAQVTNPEHAAQSFYRRLVQVPNWRNMPLTRAVQAVQVSAFPMAYAKWELEAATLVANTYVSQAAKAAAHVAASATHK
jgi:hypothetical protein